MPHRGWGHLYLTAGRYDYLTWLMTGGGVDGARRAGPSSGAAFTEGVTRHRLSVCWRAVSPACPGDVKPTQEIRDALLEHRFGGQMSFGTTVSGDRRSKVVTKA